MALDLTYPWALLLLPFGIAAVVWIDRRYRLHAPSLKQKATLAVRLLLTAVLALAIAAPTLPMASGKTVRWLLLDVSDSARGSRAQMETAVRDALAALPKGEEAGVIAFGNGAMVEVSPDADPVFTGAHTAVKGDGSDLDQALFLANALLPPDGGGGIVVLSDGEADVSDAAIGVIAARGIRVDALTFPNGETPDAQVSQLTAPAEAYEGQSVLMEAVIDANAPMDGTLALYQNGKMTASREVSLRKGENRFAFRETAGQTGVVTYEARFLANGDGQSRNNSAAAYVRVNGAPNVLLVTDGGAVGDLLAAAGMKITTVRPAEMPLSAEEYLAYDGTVLNNIDHDAATQTQWTALDGAVRSLGRGLCVLGGDRSYALGGYRGTLLEDLLPVTIDVKNKAQLPSLSLVIAIDNSGSMTAGRFGTSRIEVAKEAAISALEVLTQRDSLGVIGFDDTAKWVVPFQQVTDVAALQSMIGTLRADGGTAFYSPLSLALDTLTAANTAQKHVIFLSDGEPGDAGFEDLAANMRRAGITLTTVAVGGDADTRLMDRLATIGGGRSYQTDEFSDVPKIFAKETMMAGESYVQNRTFTPVVTETSSLTDFEGFPALDGYLTATEKATATVSLVSDMDDPLLARWNAGAGTVLAWTSDAEGAWTEAFLRWDQASAFFGGLVAAVIPGGSREGTLTADIQDDTLHIVYTSEEQNEDGLSTTVTAIAPDGTALKTTLTQTDAGVYEGELAAEEQGAYALRLAQIGADGGERALESGAVKAFAGEYDLRKAAKDGLERLVAATGGQSLAEGDSLFAAPITGARTRRSLQGALLVVTLCLLLLDIALRKLAWEDALLKALGAWRQSAETRRAEKNERPEKSERERKAPALTRREVEQGRQQAAAKTADALLSAKRARKGE